MYLASYLLTCVNPVLNFIRNQSFDLPGQSKDWFQHEVQHWAEIVETAVSSLLS